MTEGCPRWGKCKNKNVIWLFGYFVIMLLGCHTGAWWYVFLYTPLSILLTIPCRSQRISMVFTLLFDTSKPFSLMVTP